LNKYYLCRVGNKVSKKERYGLKTCSENGGFSPSLES
jgi:hypothetical protein